MKGALVAALLDEALVGLWRARGMTLLSILQIAVSVVLVGFFLLASENLGGLVATLRDETAITVFLRRDATDADRQDLERLARESGLVGTVRHVTPDMALQRFAASWRSLATAAESLSGNPFPASVELDLAKGAAASAALPAFLRNLAAHRAAEDVQFDVEWIRKLRRGVDLVARGGLALGLLLALGAAFTIANVVRLTILLHRDEIDILRLVGAPELLIRGPFLLGGVLQGTLGGLLALGLLAAVHALLISGGGATGALLGLVALRFLPVSSSVVLVLGGTVAGLVGGAVAVRRKNV